MPSLFQTIAARGQETFQRAVSSADKIGRHRLAWAGLVLAAILFLSVNLFAATAFRNVRLDLTQDRLFTISEGTRSALASLDEPVSVRVYFSRRLGELAPSYAKSFERVRALLERYRDLSGGKLEISYFDPEPFSDAEDRAVAAGLQGVRLDAEGDVGYFGLAATNSTDNEEVIPFFAPDRERFLEYDLTKLIHTLANPKKRTVGLISGVSVDGGMSTFPGAGHPQPLPPQIVMSQIREFFEVRTLDRDVKEIPADIGVLMLVDPRGLTEQAAYAIDQYALAGGKVLAFADPVSELDRFSSVDPGRGGDGTAFGRLLKAWGVNFDREKVAADIAHARRVQFGGGRRGNITDYVVWLAFGKESLNTRDVLSGGIEQINVASAGVLAKADGVKTEVTPLLETSADAMEIPAASITMMPDAVGLLRAYKPGGRRLMLAARISGEAATAFPEGPPKPAAAKDATEPSSGAAGAEAGEKPEAKAEGAAAVSASHRVTGRINAVVIADTDILNDQFWIERRDFLGQEVLIPNAHNGAFVLGALENLSGSDALISLRGRGVASRPFDLVDGLRRDAERRFRDKEQVLTARLKEMQEEAGKLERAGEGKTALLSAEDRRALEKFRSEMLSVRRELREVKHELRKDIDRLKGVLAFVNIGAVPLLAGIAGTAWAMRRRRGGARPAPRPAR